MPGPLHTSAAFGAAVLLLGGCAGGDLLAAADEDGIYCYRTLAETTCYVRPVAQNRDQLLGYDGPPPGPPPQRALGQSLPFLPPGPVRDWRAHGPETISR